jgi:hypothetical protein
MAVFPTPRMAALIPGQSPPAVRIPMRFDFVIDFDLNRKITHFKGILIITSVSCCNVDIDNYKSCLEKVPESKNRIRRIFAINRHLDKALGAGSTNAFSD